jgi:hypothetical protein
VSFLATLGAGVLTVIGAVSAFLWLNIRRPGPLAQAWNRRAFALAQLVHLSSFLMDWAYGPFLVSPLAMSRMGYAELSLPFLLSVAMLILHANRPDRYGWLALLGGLQFLTWIPLLLWVEAHINVSFLENGTMVALSSSGLSLFVLVGYMIQDVPPPESWRGRIVYLRRERALAAIEALAEAHGLDYTPPRTILELGAAAGRIIARPVRIDTTPCLRPPRYRLAIETGGWSDAAPAPELPEGWRLTRTATWLRAEYLSPSAMPFVQADLDDIMTRLSSEEPRS